MLKAALRYSKDAGIATEILKVVPDILVPSVSTTSHLNPLLIALLD